MKLKNYSQHKVIYIDKNWESFVKQIYSHTLKIVLHWIWLAVNSPLWQEVWLMGK